ncbi:MAG TPA: hypothetical protein VKN99_21380, partial [Polyangia bacterium]|nr:hypothetical protein [Polyangia bacterium]
LQPLLHAASVRLDFLAQRRQLAHPIGDFVKAPIELGQKALDHAAGRASGMDVVELGDLVERKAKQLELSDKAKALDLAFPIHPAAPAAAADRPQQPELLVVPDGAW